MRWYTLTGKLWNLYRVQKKYREGKMKDKVMCNSKKRSGYLHNIQVGHFDNLETQDYHIDNRRIENPLKSKLDMKRCRY